MPNEVDAIEIRESIVRPENDLVLASLPDLRARLRELSGSGVSRIKLDLSSVELVDSVGIGLIVATYNSLRKTGGVLEIINASREILQLLQVLRIHQHIKVSGR